MIHAVQVSGFLDPQRRSPELLLEAWPTLLAVARAAATAGVRVSVVQAAAEDAVIERDGVALYFVGGALGASRRGGARGAAGRFLAWRVARRAAELDPDVVHLHGLGFPLHTRLLARLTGAPLLVQDHGDRPPRRWRRPLHRWGLAAARGVAFTAREQAESFVRAGVLRPNTPIHEVLEASSSFRPGPRAAARAATGIHGDPCVLCIGRLERDKDPFTVLDAVARTAPVLPGLRVWWCYTEAPLFASVRRRIDADRALAARVTLLGRVPGEVVQELCRAADLFVSASRREGSGYALLEALACGLTPVVTQIPSFRRITGERVGALVPVGDPAALAGAIVEQAGRDRAAARREARAHFEQCLSFAVLGRELRDVYVSLARATAGRVAAWPPVAPGAGRCGP